MQAVSFWARSRKRMSSLSDLPAAFSLVELPNHSKITVVGLNPRLGAFSHMATFEICKDWAIDRWAVSDEGNGI